MAVSIMYRKGKREIMRIGKYFLNPGRNSPNYYIYWYDKQTRQTNCATLGTANLEQAKLEFAKWITVNAEMKYEKPENVLLAEIFQRYWEHHGKNVIGSSVQRRNLFLVLERTETMTVSEFTLDAQNRIAKNLSLQFKPGTIKRIMGTANAALNWAWQRRHIAAIPPTLTLPDSPPRERILTIEEMARLWDAAESDHIRTFLLLAISTAARPSALLELTTFQCDFERNLIDLNPKGRQQTKKRRPVVPIAGYSQTMASDP